MLNETQKLSNKKVQKGTSLTDKNYNLDNTRKNQMMDWFRAYSDRIDSRKIDEGMIPPYVINDLGRNNFFGMGISEKYGGIHFPVSDTLEILEMIAGTDISVAILILDSLLSAYTIENFAAEKIKQNYLHDMAQGRVLSAVAITESAAGSNPRAMETTAVQDSDGNWVLDGVKRWVGYASWAGFINVYARTIIDGKDAGISGFFVPAGTQGLQINEEAQTMGIKGFPKHTITLNNVRVSSDHVLGEIGRGMESAQQTFMFIRLCMGSICLGAIKKSLQISTTYAGNRSIATGSLLDNPTSRIVLTDLIHGTTVLESLLNVISIQSDNKMHIPEPAYLVAKILGGELLSDATDRSIQMLGARGYDEANGVAQMYRDGRPFRIFEGPTEVLQNYLGTQAFYEQGEVYDLLENNLNNQELSCELRKTVSLLKKRYHKEQIFNEDDTDLWIYSVIGEITLWTILSSVMRGVDNDELTRKWVDSKLESKILKYSQSTPSEKGLLSSSTIIDKIESYEKTVGSLKVKRFGYDLLPDQLTEKQTKTKSVNVNCDQETILEWNNKNIQESDLSIGQLLLNAAQKFTSKKAISLDGHSISYTELDVVSNALSRILEEKGVESGDLVGLACERSIDMVIGMISILKLGGGYVPLDRSHPSSFNDQKISETDMSFILTQRDYQISYKSEAELVFIDEIIHHVRNNNMEPEDINYVPDEFDPGNTAYVIYTSGSTGKPKGVCISHQALTNFVQSTIRKYNLSENDKVLQFASVNFDASIEEIFPTLSSGGELVLRTESSMDTYSDFLSNCTQWDITILNLPTMFWSHLVASEELQNLDYKLPENLRTVIVGGDKLSQKALDNWDRLKAEHIDLWDTYGPTEATVVVMSKLVRGSSVQCIPKNETLTIGKPDEFVFAYVVNDQLEPVPIGTEGELLIGGPILGEYLKRPELNSARFIDAPFGNAKMTEFGSDTVYRTGDLVKVLPNGELQYIGRNDDQVKIRGHRVEIGEIEACLVNCPEVTEAAVFCHETNGFKELLAGIVLLPDSEHDLDSIRKYLKSVLPEYMLPSRITVLVDIPMTLSGKIDRIKVLAAILNEINNESNKNQNYGAQSDLINIWQNALNVQVDESSNFFSVGGHSLTVMKVIGDITKKMGVSISTREFFQNPTINDQSELIKSKLDRCNASDTLDEVSDLSRQVTEGEFQLSRPQLQYYLHGKMYPTEPLYNEPVMLSVSSMISKERLQLALNELIQRHSIFRTSYHQTDRSIFQTVHDQVDLTVNYSDLSHLDQEEVEKVLKNQSQACLDEIFDLEIPCQIRCILFNLNNQSKIFLVFHHLTLDGHSLYNVFLPELEQMLTGDSNVLTKTVQYSEITHAEIVPCSQQKIEFWVSKLDQFHKVVLPIARSIDNPSVRGNQMVLEISESVLSGICGEMGTTRFNVLSAALNILLTNYTSQKTIALGTIVNNRPQYMNETMGVFSETAVMLTHCDERSSLLDFTQKVQESFLDTIENIIPYEELVRLARQKGIDELIQVAIIYEPLAKVEHRFDVDMHFVHSGTAKFDILFRFEEQVDGSVLMRIEYKSDLYSMRCIQKMAAHLERVLETMAQNVEMKLYEIDFVNDQETNLLIGVERSISPLTCHQLFEQQALLTPHDTAVIYGRHEISYQALNECSNRKVKFLTEKGVKPGDLVGVYLPRSIHQISTVIAILKAGAVMVPLDPAYPKDRLKYIMDHTDIDHVITESSLPALKAEFPGTIFLDEHYDTIRAMSSENPDIQIKLDSPAYITFTSGSTGKPKGARVGHKPLSNLIQWQNNRSQKSTRTLQYTPLSFDVSFQEIFSTLTSGGALILIEDSDRKNPIRLIEHIKEYEVDRIFVPYVTLKQMADAVHFQMEDAPLCLKEIITAGEQLKVTDEIRNLIKEIPGSSLDNQYGPCETHVVTGAKLNAKLVNEWDALPPIGKPIDNVALKILNESGIHVPQGTPGVLHIGIDYDEYGYIGNSTETDKKFVQIEGEIYYRTGDIVKMDDNGDIHWLNREDHQLKIRGYRVESGEVENALINTTHVDNAVVSMIEQAGENVIVAYVKLNPEFSMIDPSNSTIYDQIKQELKEVLPSYMIPTFYMTIDKFELTPSGKIDRLSLPQFVREAEPTLNTSAELETDINNIYTTNLQREISQLFAETLDLDPTKISVDSSFFEMGGSSLNAFLLTTKISRQYSINMDPSILMNHATPALLAETLGKEDLFDLSSLVVIREEGSLPPIFLVPGSGGTLDVFDHLIEQLPNDRPIYGFVHPRLRGNTSNFNTINDLAQYYVNCLGQKLELSSCYLAGHCFGGAVAYEMKRILDRNSIKAIPIIIDTPVPQESTRQLPVVNWSYAEWVAIVGEVLAENAGRPIDVMDDFKHFGPDEALNSLKERLVKEGLYAASSSIEHLKLIVDMLKELDLSFVNYIPARSTDKIYFVRATDMTDMDKLGILASGNDHVLWGWEEVSNKVQSRTVRGDHNSMLDPENVSDITEFILECFKQNDLKLHSKQCLELA